MLTGLTSALGIPSCAFKNPISPMVWSAFLPKNTSQLLSALIEWHTVTLTMHVGDEDRGHFSPFDSIPNRRLQFELSARAFRAIDH